MANGLNAAIDDVTSDSSAHVGATVEWNQQPPVMGTVPNVPFIWARVNPTAAPYTESTPCLVTVGVYDRLPRSSAARLLRMLADDLEGIDKPLGDGGLPTFVTEANTVSTFS
jgi:hypothetical protein